MAGGPLQAADDMVRIIANGLTFGLPDKLEGGDAAAKTAAARDRAGLAGDVANVGSQFYGGKGILKGLWSGGKAAVKLAAPAAKAVAAHPWATLASIGVGGQSLADYNARTGAGQAKAASPPAAKAAAAPKTGAKAGTANADRVTAQIMSALNDADGQPPTYADLAQQLSASQGGVSLRQLGVLAEAEQRAAPKAAKVTPPNYAVTARLQSYYDGLHAQEIASGVPQGEADANWAARYQDLLKLDPLNPMLRDSDEEN